MISMYRRRLHHDISGKVAASRCFHLRDAIQIAHSFEDDLKRMNIVISSFASSSRNERTCVEPTSGYSFDMSSTQPAGSNSSNSRHPNQDRGGQTSGYCTDTSMDIFPDLSPGGASTNGWQDQSSDGGEGGRVITVRWGRITKQIGIDGSYIAIRDTIRCAFGLRARRDFWLEDEDGIVRPLDRDMPPGTYNLSTANGCIMHFCYSMEPNHVACEVYTKSLTTQEDLSEFLERCGWIGVRILEDDQIVDWFDDIQPNLVYHGLRRM